MKGNLTPVIVRIFAMPMAGCDPKKTWQNAAALTEERLHAKYGGSVETRFVELFSPESFNFPEVMSLLEKGEYPPPYITVNGVIVPCKGKISEPGIRRQLELLGIAPTHS